MSAYTASSSGARAQRSIRSQSPRSMGDAVSGSGSKWGSEECRFSATTGPSAASRPSSRYCERMNSARSYSVSPVPTRSPAWANASWTMRFRRPAAHRCESSCAGLQRCVANCTRSADETTSTPRSRTVSRVPPSTLEILGSAPPGEYSIAAVRALPIMDFRLASMSCRLTKRVVGSPTCANRPWSTNPARIFASPSTGTQTQQGRVTFARGPRVSCRTGFMPR